MIRFEQVVEGMEHGDISVVDSPNDDGAVCKIGDNWFYFGGQEAEDMTAAAMRVSVVSIIVNLVLSLLKLLAACITAGILSEATTVIVAVDAFRPLAFSST